MEQPSKAQHWAGWILTGLLGALMIFGGSIAIINPPGMADQFTGKFGYPADLFKPLGITEICCGILFLIPRTTALGAVLLTAYLGGAVATHVRVHDNFIPPVVAGMLVWLAVYLRDWRVRALLPLRAKN